MNVLSLTHAHLRADGLSPVSCERADSLVNAWSKELNWHIDVVHTTDTLWRGIWPNGNGLQINIIHQEAPQYLMMGVRPLFSSEIKELLAKKQFARVASLIGYRISKRIRRSLSESGVASPGELVKAKKWGQLLLNSASIRHTKYDFIFACVGYSDEYLLQTAFTISEKLKVPMIVDFRDLWSEHHDPGRFTEKQKSNIRNYEKRLLKNTVLLSVPQKPMLAQLEKSTKIPVHLTSHSAHIEKDWKDGTVTDNEFRMLYAGKLYPGSPGLTMLLDLLQTLVAEQLNKPVKCYFFVDDTATINALIAARGLSANVVIHEWVAPAEIWAEMRSAHLLITYDSGISQSMPLLMTKTYQYAYSGRPIMALYKYENSSYSEFFEQYNAGSIFYNIKDAAAWVKVISADEDQYKKLPTFGNVLLRDDEAVKFALKIKQLLK